MTRVFDAEPGRVFEALTTPAIVRQWCCPKGWTFDTCDIDLRVDGKWRFQMSQPNGKRIGQFGVYLEVVPNERLVNTEAWEDWDAGETLVKTVLAGGGGTTRFTCTILFPSQEVRDIVLKSGLEDSVGPLYQKLANALASTARTTA
jgi:uncharacterized protein YndB with AHSA1/START domain